MVKPRPAAHALHCTALRCDALAHSPPSTRRLHSDAVAADAQEPIACWQGSAAQSSALITERSVARKPPTLHAHVRPATLHVVLAQAAQLWGAACVGDARAVFDRTCWCWFRSHGQPGRAFRLRCIRLHLEAGERDAGAEAAAASSAFAFVAHAASAAAAVAAAAPAPPAAADGRRDVGCRQRARHLHARRLHACRMHAPRHEVESAWVVGCCLPSSVLRCISLMERAQA